MVRIESTIIGTALLWLSIIVAAALTFPNFGELLPVLISIAAGCLIILLGIYRQGKKDSTGRK